VNAITATALISPKLQSPRRTFAFRGFTNATARVKIQEPIRSRAADEYRDLGDAFAEFADESFEWATNTFEAAVETWPSE
jgi:hypothetical protein